MNNQFTYPKEKIRFAILTFFFAQGIATNLPTGIINKISPQ